MPRLADVPPRLYKYFKPAVIKHVLAEKTLLFTQPKDFNDPFELFPTMDSYLRPLMSALLLEGAKADHLKTMRETMKRLFSKEDLDLRLDLDQLLEEQIADEHSDAVTQMRRTVSYKIHKMSTKERRSYLAAMRDHLNLSFGVLCLSAVPDSILMWSHYADSHKGFALEFDAADSFFDQRLFPTDPLRCVRKVRYQTERPPRAFFEPKYWLRSDKSRSLDLLEYMAGVLLLTKSIHWSYEQEWRMVIPIVNARKVDDNGYVLNLPPRCILRVIIGSAMSDANIKHIFEILDQPEFFHVEVLRAVCDTQRFRVVLHDDISIIEKKLLQDIEQFPDDGVQQRIDRLQVTTSSFYSAQAALVAKEWIAIPQYDRSKQKRKIFKLTEAGSARLAERRQAAKAWAELHKSESERFIDKIVSAPPDHLNALAAEHFLEIMHRDKEKLVRQTMEPEILRHFAALGSDDEDVRWNAAEALRKVGDANVVENLISILDWRQYEELAWIHDSSQASNVTKEEIEEIESDAPVAYWLLGHRELWGSDELTQLAAYALAGITARIAADDAIDALIGALKEPDGDTRWCAAEALGHLASLRALPELERLAESDDTDTSFGSVKDAALVAIRRVKEAQKQGKART